MDDFSRPLSCIPCLAENPSNDSRKLFEDFFLAGCLVDLFISKSIQFEVKLKTWARVVILDTAQNGRKGLKRRHTFDRNDQILFEWIWLVSYPSLRPWSKTSLNRVTRKRKRIDRQKTCPIAFTTASQSHDSAIWYILLDLHVAARFLDSLRKLWDCIFS